MKLLRTNGDLTSLKRITNQTTRFHFNSLKIVALVNLIWKKR